MAKIYEYEEKHTKRAWIEAESKKEAKQKIRNGEQPIQTEDLLEVNAILSSVEKADYNSIPVPSCYIEKKLLDKIDDPELKSKIRKELED